MLLGLAGAFGAAGAYGVGSILQEAGARRTAASESLDPRLLLRLVRQAPYVVGIGLDLVGFALSFVALRTLPLFLVQAAVAASIGVTALLAAAMLHQRPTRRETTALIGVGAGLVLLAVSAAPDSPAHVSLAFRSAVLGAAVVVAVVGSVLARRPGNGVALGALGGLAFGGVGIAARAIAVPHPLWHGLGDPLTYALVGSALLGMLLYATALQRAGVTVATAVLFATETVGPALVGLLALGDRARPGLAPVSAAGFVVTVVACLALTRYAQV